MSSIKQFISDHSILVFLILTLFISLVAFAFIATVPGAGNPEGMPGLPFWLVAVWGPSLAAIIIKMITGEIGSFLKQAFNFEGINPWWLFSLAPLVVTALVLLWEVLQGTSINWGGFKFEYLVPLILMNLILGPLGEELGWRGFLGPLLEKRFGIIGAAFVVGFIWAIWHGPLWFVESPQKEIPFLVFSANVLCFSIIMASLYHLGGGSLVPIISFHLFLNVSSGFVSMIDVYKNHGTFYERMLILYALVAVIFIVMWWFVPNGINGQSKQSIQNQNWTGVLG
jgi:membrane protease YdiL (CAAX protease family)